MENFSMILKYANSYFLFLFYFFFLINKKVIINELEFSFFLIVKNVMT